jgi:hypothetical protein
MDFLFTYGLLISVALTAALVIVSTIVAIDGLKRDDAASGGKLTRSGRRTADVIVFLGVCTFSSAVWQEILADRKAERDDAERKQQFNAQTQRFNNVTRSQGLLLDKTDETLAVSAATQRQARRAADQVLQKVFDEGNHVTPEEIVLTVHATCPSHRSGLSRYVLLHDPRLTIVPRGGVPQHLEFSSIGSPYRVTAADLGPLAERSMRTDAEAIPEQQMPRTSHGL